jgi:hypothetical protein
LRGVESGSVECETRVIEGETGVVDVEVETAAIIEMGMRVDTKRVRFAVMRSWGLKSAEGDL